MFMDMGAYSRLAAFIRFDRNSFNDARMFVRALAYNLASFDDRLGKAIANVVAANGNILKHPSLSFQLKKLVLEPFEQVPDMLYEGPLVVAVDGIDECVRHSTETSRAELLQLFASWSLQADQKKTLCPLSQEKPHIHTFPLDIMSSETQSDINYFLDTKLSKLISKSSAEFRDLCAQRKAVRELSIRASGLFIWASTAITFIESYPEERLLVILKTSMQVNAQSALTVLYRTALDCIAKGTEDDDIRADVQVVLGRIRCQTE
ncbi:hypothetical protein MPER_09560 [Moniliophthora perniciosa FA553]|nr:hypothetical protein MPER_09560 [Moniliophthora perniciosa FA553]